MVFTQIRNSLDQVFKESSTPLSGTRKLICFVRYGPKNKWTDLICWTFTELDTSLLLFVFHSSLVICVTPNHGIISSARTTALFFLLLLLQLLFRKIISIVESRLREADVTTSWKTNIDHVGEVRRRQVKWWRKIRTIAPLNVGWDGPWGKIRRICIVLKYIWTPSGIGIRGCKKVSLPIYRKKVKKL